jgi:Protein of unknown function (DUF3237)
MMKMNTRLATYLLAALAIALGARVDPPAGPASAQEKLPIGTEFLATLHAPLDEPQAIGTDLLIYNVPGEGGYVRGPRIEGRLIQPCADWLRVLPGGNLQLDVRCTIRTGDGGLVYVEYGGLIAWNDALQAKCQAGEVIDGSEVYFRTQPRFRTGADRYSWLNGVVALGAMTSFKCGEGSYVEYDIYRAK